MHGILPGRWPLPILQGGLVRILSCLTVFSRASHHSGIPPLVSSHTRRSQNTALAISHRELPPGGALIWIQVIPYLSEAGPVGTAAWALDLADKNDTKVFCPGEGDEAISCSCGLFLEWSSQAVSRLACRIASLTMILRTSQPKHRLVLLLLDDSLLDERCRS